MCSGGNGSVLNTYKSAMLNSAKPKPLDHERMQLPPSVTTRPLLPSPNLLSTFSLPLPCFLYPVCMSMSPCYARTPQRISRFTIKSPSIPRVYPIGMRVCLSYKTTHAVPYINCRMAEMAIIQSRNQRLIVDKTSSSSIDKTRARGEKVKVFPIHYVVSG